MFVRGKTLRLDHRRIDRRILSERLIFLDKDRAALDLFNGEKSAKRTKDSSPT